MRRGGRGDCWRLSGISAIKWRASPRLRQHWRTSERGDHKERRLMANPEMSGAQQQDLGAVPPQGRPESVDAPVTSFRERSESSRAGLPLLARVLLADLGVVIVALIVLTVVEVQRLGDASLHLRRQAYAEDLVVLFLVAAVFGVVAYLLLRAGHARVAIVQAVVTALVFGVAVTSAVAGNPKATQVTPVDQDQ
jgi:hypothetical protein